MCILSYTLFFFLISFKSSLQFSQVSQLSPTPCNPMGCSTTRLPCPSPAPGACSNSCPSSQKCHPTIPFSVIPFSSCPESSPASGSFPMSQFFHHVAKVLELQLQHQFFSMNGIEIISRLLAIPNTRQRLCK